MILFLELLLNNAHQALDTHLFLPRTQWHMLNNVASVTLGTPLV